MKRLWLVKSSNMKNSALRKTIHYGAALRLSFFYEVNIVKFP